MATERIALRVDTAANWAAANPTLAAGEQGIESESGNRKIGDGATAWNTLPYIGVPPGVLQSFAGSGAAPHGYLLCDGAAISRTVYAPLFAAIGTAWGSGDETTTFNLPDGRGAVLRGSGTGTVNARDKVGPAVGAKQEDQMQRITGQFLNINGLAGGTVAPDVDGAVTTQTNDDSSGRIGGTVVSRWQFNLNSGDSPDARASATTAGETRPYSVGVQWIIKF